MPWNLKHLSLYIANPQNENRCKFFQLALSEVNAYFLGFVHMVVQGPINQVFYLFPGCWLITTRDLANNNGVVIGFKYGMGSMLSHTVMDIKSVEQADEFAALRDTCVDDQ